jgi:8-oxo-dGTP pyrophosphatase MutT (NUDIX family)
MRPRIARAQRQDVQVPAEGPATPRHSATIIVLRDGPETPEALLLRRHGRSGFAADAWVFPGGVVEDGDRTLDPQLWTGIDPAALQDRFRLSADLVLGMHVAAVRETFEEAGLLLAARADGTTVDLADPGVQRMRRVPGGGDRAGERASAAGFAAWLAEERLVLDLARLTYWSRWVTPAQEPRRYDTCFFVARAPEGQIPVHDSVETTGHRWVSARDALSANDLPLIYPTRKNLEELARLADVDAVVAHAEARKEVRSVQPHVELDAQGRPARILHPDEAAFPRHLYQPAR